MLHAAIYFCSFCILRSNSPAWQSEIVMHATAGTTSVATRIVLFFIIFLHKIGYTYPERNAYICTSIKNSRCLDFFVRSSPQFQGMTSPIKMSKIKKSHSIKVYGAHITATLLFFFVDNLAFVLSSVHDFEY